MAFDWDEREYREDHSRCLVCRTEELSWGELFCSATCADVFGIRGQENDCYA